MTTHSNGQDSLQATDIPSGLEVVTDQNHDSKFDTPRYADGKQVVPETEEKIFADESADAAKPRSRKLLWIGLGVLAVLIVVGAVVGGVVGSKAGKSHSKDKSNPDNSTSNDESSLTIRPNAPLAATGWRMQGKSNARVFWQGKDDFMYYSAWDSGHNSWDKPVKFATGAVPDSPVAACVIYQSPSADGGPPDPQVQFYYKNGTGYMNGENFRASYPEGLPDSINHDDYIFKVGDDTTLAAYWPAIIFQNPNMQALWYSPNASHYEAVPDPLSDASVLSSPKTPVAVLPMQREHPDWNQTADPETKIIYRRNDGYLYDFQRWANGSTVRNDQLKGFKIADTGSLAAFTTARDDHSPNLNTYVVYQAEDGKIMYGTNTDKKAGWDGPLSDAVFNGADNPTHLACITAFSGMYYDYPLTPSTDLSRCYFQKKGVLVEVMFDGSTWSFKGPLPMSN